MLGIVLVTGSYKKKCTSSFRNIDAGEEEEKKLVKIAVQLP